MDQNLVQRTERENAEKRFERFVSVGNIGLKGTAPNVIWSAGEDAVWGFSNQESTHGRSTCNVRSRQAPRHRCKTLHKYNDADSTRGMVISSSNNNAITDWRRWDFTLT